MVPILILFELNNFAHNFTTWDPYQKVNFIIKVCFLANGDIFRSTHEDCRKILLEGLQKIF
jgi:hypothetical protein